MSYLPQVRAPGLRRERQAARGLGNSAVHTWQVQHSPRYAIPGEAWSYPGKDDIASYLQAYAREFELPVRTGVKVHAIGSDGGGYLLESSEGAILLDPNIAQFHSADYREVSQINEGPVLVVGAGGPLYPVHPVGQLTSDGVYDVVDQFVASGCCG